MPEIRLVDESDARSIQRIYAPYVRRARGQGKFELANSIVETLQRPSTLVGPCYRVKDHSRVRQPNVGRTGR